MEFEEELTLLADKAYPELTLEARERFPLNQYFTHLTDPQIAFAVRQTKPTTIDAAVQATLEMKLYAKPLPGRVAQLVEESIANEPVAAAGLQKTCDMRVFLENMEAQLKELQQPGPWGYSRSRGQWRTGALRSHNCWNSGGEGHLSRECPFPKTTQQQGNGNPPTLWAKRRRRDQRLT